MTSTGREGCAPMTPDLIARLRSQIAQSEAYYEHAHIRPSPWMGMMAEAAGQLEALRNHAEAMAKVMARIGRAEPCHCARCTAMGEDARQALAAYRSAFPEKNDVL